MTFEIARDIHGSHSISGGAASDGVFFGTLPAESVPEVFISRVSVAGAFPRVVVRDANGASVTYADETVDASVLTGTVNWPNSTTPINDKLLLGVPANKVIKGFALLLGAPTNWTDNGLVWALSYPTTSALTELPYDAATSSPPSMLRTGVAGTMITVNLSTPLDTNSITPQPYGGTDTYERRIEVGLSGTITGGTTFPLISRIWPVYEVAESMSYFDFTSVIQPMSGTPDYSGWPTSIVTKSGDETLIGCGEWPILSRMIIDAPSGTSGVSTYRYSSTTGMKDLPAEYVNDPSDFGRAAVGTYQIRLAKPDDAAKMWLLTYTLSGSTYTVFGLSEPSMPSGAVQVRKMQTYFWGRKYGASSTSLVSAFNLRLGCRSLDPATMTSSNTIVAADSLKSVAIEAEFATNAAGESSWFVANTKTGKGVLVRGTLSTTNNTMSATTSVARSANDGVLLVKIRDKTTAGGEATGGELIISG